MSQPVIVEHRCVVLLGKSGAGKSTVANMLVDHKPLSGRRPPFDVSQQVLQSVTYEVKDRTVRFYRENIEYNVKVVDTVGLFDTKAEGNDTIMEKMEKYFKDRVGGINLFLFVFKKGRFTKEEQEVFYFLRKTFDKEISPISALAVTGCEQDIPEVREKLVEEFGSDPSTNEIALQMQLGIYPVGFPPIKQMDPPLQSYYAQKMEQDRETLWDLIIRSDDAHLTKELFEEKVKPVIQRVIVERKIPCTLL